MQYVLDTLYVPGSVNVFVQLCICVHVCVCVGGGGGGGARVCVCSLFQTFVSMCIDVCMI